MRLLAFFLVAAIQVNIAYAGGVFYPEPHGYPVFEQGTIPCPPDYDERSTCKRLAEPFGYFVNEIGFEAKAGLITDGASIPPWAQSFIGNPHDKAFSRAATLHDYYVLEENAVYSYLVTQRMFYDALIASDVDKRTARRMYLAVLIGAPKWSLFYTAKPEKCVLGIPNCKRDGTVIPPDEITNYVSSAYDYPGFERQVSEIEANIDIETATLEELERRALTGRLFMGLDTPPPAKYGDAETTGQ